MAPHPYGMHAKDLWVALRRFDDPNRDRDAALWRQKIETLTNSCHPHQRSFATDPGIWVSALVGRGGGKTTGGMVRFMRRLMGTKRAQCLYIATTRTHAEELMWTPIKQICDRLGIAATFNETKLICTITRTGSKLYLAGADDKKQIEKYRGRPFHEVGIDECASLSQTIFEHLVDRIIAPRLGDYNGTLWCIGTPNHQLFGEFYEVTRPGSPVHRHWSERDLPEFEGWDKWSHHTWSLEDAAAAGIKAAINLWERALQTKAAKGWTDENPVWRREYLGLWAADDSENIYKYRPHLDDGMPWNQWDPERDKDGFAKLPEEFSDWSFAFGMDPGHSDPFALVVFAWSPSDSQKRLFHVYEFEKRAMHARTIAKLILGEELSHEHPTGVIAKTGWPDSFMVDSAPIGQTLLDELAKVYGISIAPSPRKPGDKYDSIALFNGDLIDGRIKVLKGSELEKQLASLQWEIDDFGRLKEPRGQQNDLCDAAIYARRGAAHLYSEEPEPAPRKFKPSPIYENPDADLEREPDDEFGLLDSGHYDDSDWSL